MNRFFRGFFKFEGFTEIKLQDSLVNIISKGYWLNILTLGIGMK